MRPGSGIEDLGPFSFDGEKGTGSLWGVLFKTSSRSWDKLGAIRGLARWGLFTPFSSHLNRTRVCSASISLICHAEEAVCSFGVLKG